MKILIFLLFFIPLSAVADQGPPTFFMEQQVIDKINRYRVQHHLKELVVDAKITQLARVHSYNLVHKHLANKHAGFNERARALMSYNLIGENVAYVYNAKDTVQAAFDGWTASTHHHENILGDYNKTGVGVARSTHGDVYITQIFLSK